MKDPEPEVCAECGGEGFVEYTAMQHDGTCDGGGERCARLCPVQVQAIKRCPNECPEPPS